MLRGILAALLEEPQEPAHRAALTDWLLERADPRAELLQLLPRLCALPRRAELRPDLLCEVYQGAPRHLSLLHHFNHLGWRDTRLFWPQLPTPKPPWAIQVKGLYAPYRKVRQLGKLLALALVVDSKELADVTLTDSQALVRWELSYCGLLPSDPRLRVWPSTPGLLGGIINNCRNCRRFRAYQGVADLLTATCWQYWHKERHTIPGWPTAHYPEVMLQILRLRATVYGRYLDLAEEFTRSAPWTAALAVTLRRKELAEF